MTTKPRYGPVLKLTLLCSIIYKYKYKYKYKSQPDAYDVTGIHNVDVRFHSVSSVRSF